MCTYLQTSRVYVQIPAYSTFASVISLVSQWSRGQKGADSCLDHMVQVAHVRHFFIGYESVFQ